ncbi:MAG: oligosaccharide flippase family protein [Clostridia bacterium]|nr:oligosaccharide flippase family protein [Clostridia bacterium]
MIFLTERGKFIKGTVILICANAIAKILGAVFKIPLTYILGEEGMAVYQTAFSVYMMFLSLVTSGFPFAVTKLLAEYNALGKEDRIRPVVKSIGTVLLLVGLAASSMMYIFAPHLALSMREPGSVGAIRAISFSVVLVSIGAVIKSSNEALSDLLPTAFSQVSEATVKLFLGLFLAYKFASISVFKAAEGAVWSVTIGEAFATTLLVLVWRFRVRKLPAGKSDSKELRAIFAVAIPLLMTGAATGLLGMAEVAVIRHSLSSIIFSAESAQQFLAQYSAYTDVFDKLAFSLTLTPDGVRKLYGAFSGYAQTVFNLPVGIIATVSAAATPMFASAINVGKDTAKAAERVLSLILSLALPSAAVCFFFPESILNLLFGNRFSADMLRSLAPALIFLSSSNMLICALHLAGKIFEPFIALTAGLIIKIILSAVLVRIPYLNIIGAGIATCISSFVIFLALAHLFKRNFGGFVSFPKLLSVPFAASCVMVGLMSPFNAALSVYINEKAAFLASCFIGSFGYILTTVLLRKNNSFTITLGSKKMQS